jgi:hypothetical protein
MEQNFDNKKLRRRMGFPLLIWAPINIIVGSFYITSSSDFIRGVLTMTFIWGIINGILGLTTFFGKKIYVLEKIKKVLLVNVYLDIGYAIVGLLLIFFGNFAILIGSGYAIIVQGILLFVLDFLHHKHVKELILLQ